MQAKTYSYEFDDPESKPKQAQKGIPSRKRGNHEEFSKALHDQTKRMIRYKKIQAVEHKLYTVEVEKETLSPFDDKRYICDDGINTYAWGHIKTIT